MRTSTIQPTGIERTFDPDEIIVSKTDRAGRITYANSVFLRMYGADEADVLGKPHNIVRHPAMPRCVFKLLWDTIESGHEIFAYVLNLAADGSHYWVLAHVTPSFGLHGEIVGYHSNRRCPERRAIDAIRPLYGDLLAEEQRHRDPVAGIAAGCALLERTLSSLGTDYDSFVWSLTAGVAA